MNDLQVFNNPEFGSVRTIEESGAIWFCGKDSALALGYTNTNKAINDHCKTPGVTIRSVGVQTGIKTDGTPAMQQVDMKFINEPNLYRLITHSKLPTAEKFERWIFEEVLPAIRKTGSYSVKQQERMLTLDDYMKAASIVAGCKNERLPYVIHFLQTAGFSMPEVEQVERVQTESIDLVELLNQYSLNELCEKLGICRTSLYYYRSGKVKPHNERYKVIVSALERR